VDDADRRSNSSIEVESGPIAPDVRRRETPIVGLSSRTPFVAMGGCFSASFPARRPIDPVISTNRGRVVNTAGDSVLVEFASVVDAVRAAIDVQRATTIRTADFVPEKRIEFRAKESR